MSCSPRRRQDPPPAVACISNGSIGRRLPDSLPPYRPRRAQSTPSGVVTRSAYSTGLVEMPVEARCPRPRQVPGIANRRHRNHAESSESGVGPDTLKKGRSQPCVAFEDRRLMVSRPPETWLRSRTSGVKAHSSLRGGANRD